jgi:hypothetical protein
VTQEYKRQPLPEWSEVLAEKDLEIKMLRTRLEVDERHPYDGIYCRDETIRLQDAEISRLRSMIVVQEAIIRLDEAEIEKLRAALEKAVCYLCDFNAHSEAREIRAKFSGDSA